MKLALKNFAYFILDILQTVTVAFGFFAVVYLFVVQLHKVNGDSMLPNFHNAEYLLTNKLVYLFRAPQRGDVIIFKFPPMPSSDYIKRVIGLPGEEIEIRNDRIIIYNQGHPEGLTLDETYLPAGTATVGKSYLPKDTRIKIPEGNYVVMGDNRTHSSDSREWGFVPRENIIGRGWLRIWPPDALAFIPQPSY